MRIMKIQNRFILFILSLVMVFSIKAEELPKDPISIEGVYTSLVEELNLSLQNFKAEHLLLQKEIDKINALFLNNDFESNEFQKLYVKKMELEQRLDLNELAFSNNAIEIRYRKGLDLIKLLYEKVLGLEHHFSGMAVYQNVDVLSNPNSYPEFAKAKNLFEEKKTQKVGFTLPTMLDSNPFLSATFALVSGLFGGSKKETSNEDYNKLACILDFTVRMNGDLNTIRHEVEFLKKSNENLKKECEKLFEEYVKVVGYLVPLEKCRNDDDWEDLRFKIDEFTETFGGANTGTTYSGQPGAQVTPESNRDKVNLEFATRRVSDFIIKYIDFTTKGTQYYEKFDSIISTYENEQSCQEIFPREFTELKFDIKSTIEKFNNTYNLPEIQGSRLKNLMYGVD